MMEAMTGAGERTDGGASRGEAERALRRAWLRWSLALLGAMVVGGFLAGSFVAGRYEARLGFIARQTSAIRDQYRREEAGLREQLAAHHDLVALLGDAMARVTALRPSGPGPAAGRVVWKPGHGGILVVAGLPPAPAGSAYTAWAFASGGPQPAGRLAVGAEGGAVHRLPAGVEPAEGFAVTLEPRPPEGAPPGRPAGPIVLTSR